MESHITSHKLCRRDALFLHVFAALYRGKADLND
jgi:hypothetical protein